MTEILGYVNRASWPTSKTDLEWLHKYEPNIRRADESVNAYYVGKTSDPEGRERAHNTSNQRPMCYVVSSEFEQAMEQKFGHLKLSYTKTGRDSGSYYYRSDEMTAFVVWLLQSGQAHPTYEFVEDLQRLNIRTWNSFVVPSLDEMSTLPDGTKDLLNHGRTRSELLDRVREEFAMTSDSYILLPHFVDAVREVLADGVLADGTYDFCDAFTEHHINIGRIRARTYYTRARSGFDRANPWGKNVLINTDTEEREQALRRHYEEREKGTLLQSIIYLKPDHEHSTYVQDLLLEPFEPTLYISRGRAGMEHSNRLPSPNKRPKPMVNRRGKGESTSSNATTGHVFAYVGPDPERFKRVFCAAARGVYAQIGDRPRLRPKRSIHQLTAVA